jgi:hypothetical protein
MAKDDQNQNSNQGKADAKTIMARIEAEGQKALSEKFKAALKPELEKLNTARATVKLQEEKLNTMMEDYDNGTWA